MGRPRRGALRRALARVANTTPGRPDHVDWDFRMVAVILESALRNSRHFDTVVKGLRSDYGATEEGAIQGAMAYSVAILCTEYGVDPRDVKANMDAMEPRSR